MGDIRGYADEAEDAEEAVQKEIDDRGGVHFAFMLNDLIVDEDILNSQPNLLEEIVIPPVTWEDKRITEKEILEYWHLEEGGEYDINTKEKLAGPIVEEDYDYAVERATLPGKEINMYLGRKCMARYAFN